MEAVDYKVGKLINELITTKRHHIQPRLPFHGMSGLLMKTTESVNILVRVILVQKDIE